MKYKMNYNICKLTLKLQVKSRWMKLSVSGEKDVFGAVSPGSGSSRSLS